MKFHFDNPQKKHFCAEPRILTAEIDAGVSALGNWKYQKSNKHA